MSAESAHTIPQLLSSAADRFGDKAAIVEDGQSYSYQQLNEQRQQAAKAFIASGVEVGDRVAIWAPNVSQWIVTTLGLQSVGAILVPLNVRWSGAEAADVLRRSGAVMLFSCGPLEKGEPLDLLADESLPDVCARVMLRGAADGAASYEAFLAKGESVDDDALAQREQQLNADSIADMLFTSGTTGKPKGVLCSHEQNIRAFSTWSQTVGLRSDDRYLIINPFFHSFGYKAGWLAALISGCTIYPALSFDREKVMQQIADDRITMLPGAPSLYEMILADPNRKQYDLTSLRLGVTGAAAVPVQLVRDMRDELGFETVVTAYGLTESTGVVSICRPEDDPETIASTSGRAIDGVEVRCVDPATAEVVEPGQEGEIWVRGYNVMKGYFDMPEATAETITDDGWLRTGDIGIMDEAGYLKITDRLKDMYIMNGENVYPAEIEKCLFAHPDVAQVAVIGVPKAPQGEVGMAFVVLKDGASLDADALSAFCKERLARYKVPLYFEAIDALPMNASGKVLKPELRKRAAERAQA